jgi:hypothetical protein
MQIALLMLGLAVAGMLVGFAAGRWFVLYAVVTVALICSVAILINGSSTGPEDSFSAPGFVLAIALVYWLPFGIAMAAGIALRRARRRALDRAPRIDDLEGRRPRTGDRFAAQMTDSRDHIRAARDAAADADAEAEPEGFERQ